MKTPLNGKTLRNHLTYHWWAYLLIIIGGIFLVNLLFTVTTPRIPEEKRIDFYIYGYSDEPALNAYMDQVHEESLPDMESVTAVVSYPDSTYGPMQLMTHMAAHEGDLWLLDRENFLSYASSGVFLPLEEDKELMAIFNEAGLDLRRGWRTLSETDETHLYGIPADLLPGLNGLCYAKDGYLSVVAFGGNDENTLKFLRILCRDMLREPEAPEAAEETASG